MSLDTAMKEYERIRNRIGRNSLEVMNWLLNFAQTPLNELSTGDLANLAEELLLFITGGAGQGKHFAVIEKLVYPALMTERSIEKTMADDLQDKKKRFAALEKLIYTAINRSLSKTEMKQLQDYAQKRINQALKHDGSVFSFGRFRLIAGPIDEDGSLLLPVVRTLEEGFGYYMAHLLGEQAHRLDKCPECHRVFIAIRLHQKFCGPRCRSRVGTREFRKAHEQDHKKTLLQSRTERSSIAKP